MATTDQALWWIRGGWKSSRFAKTIVGIGTGIDVDGLYGFQCKDWANGYADFMGNPFTAGNAIALWQRNQPGWTKVQTPQVGDVFVKNYVANDGVNYGHTGVVDEIVGSGFYSYDQNVVNSSLDRGSPPSRIFHRNSEMLGYLRNNNIQGEVMVNGNDITELFVGILFRTPNAEEVARYNGKVTGGALAHELNGCQERKDLLATLIADEETIRILAVAVLKRPEPLTTTDDLRNHIGKHGAAVVKEFWYSPEGTAGNKWQQNTQKEQAKPKPPTTDPTPTPPAEDLIELKPGKYIVKDPVKVTEDK
jgi:hypothetical protein